MANGVGKNKILPLLQQIDRSRVVASLQTLEVNGYRREIARRR